MVSLAVNLCWRRSKVIADNGAMYLYTGSFEMSPHLAENEIDKGLVQRLVASQFPLLAHLGISPVSNQGWDNRTF